MTNPLSRQLSIFDVPNLDVDAGIKEAMRFSLSASRMSREKLLDEMNRLARRHGIVLTKGNGQELTLDTLEKWLNPNAAGYMPSIKALMVFMAVLNKTSQDILTKIVAPLGLKVISAQESKLLEWAKEYHAVKKAQKRMKRLESEL